MKKLALVLILTVISGLSLFSQTVDNIVENKLQLLAQGKGNQVKTELIDLMAKYPNEPGIRYLLATVSKDQTASIGIYNDIIKNNSESQWADDCYWRLIQYYAITGEISKAEELLEAMRKAYPNSNLLMPASDVLATVSSKLPAEEQIKTNASITNEQMRKQYEVELEAWEKNKENNGSGYSLTEDDQARLDILKEKKRLGLIEGDIRPGGKWRVKATGAMGTIPPPASAIGGVEPPKPPKYLPENANPETSKPITTTEKITESAVAVKEPVIESKPKTVDKIIQKETTKPSITKADTIDNATPITKSVAKAEIEEVDPPIITSNEKFGLQVGVYRELVRAETEQKFYTDKRIRSAISKKIVNGETMYSVIVGEYSTADRAEKAKRIVEKECNCKPITVPK